MLPAVFVPYLNDAFALPKYTLLKITALLAVLLSAMGLKNRKISLKAGLNPSVITLFAVYSAAFILSGDRALSFTGIYKYYFNGFLALACYMALYFSLQAVMNEERYRRLLRVFVAGSIIPVVYALVQWSGIDFVRWLSSPGGRVWSTLGNPNFLGAYIIMVIPVCAALLVIEKRPRLKALLLAQLSALITVLIITGSRASWLGFACSMVLLVFLIRTELPAARAWLPGLLTGVLIGIVFVWLLDGAAFNGLLKRLLSLFNVKEAGAAARLSGYKVALEIIMKNPLSGIGPDVFSLQFRQYMPRALEGFSNTLANAGYAHNELLQVMLDAGILGLAAYLWVIKEFFVNAYTAVVKHSNEKKVLAAGVMCSVLALLLQNQFSFSIVATSVYFWVFLSLMQSMELVEPVVKKKRPVMIYPAIILSVLLFFYLGQPVIADYYYSGGNHLMDMGDTLKAKNKYEKAVKLNKTLSVYRISLGRALNMLANSADGRIKEDYIEKAVKEFQEQVNRHPLNALGWNGLGVSLQVYAKIPGHEGLHADSIAAFLKAVELDPGLEESQLHLAFGYEKLGLADRAIDAYNRVLEINPGNAGAHFNLGCIYGNNKEHAKAVYHWAKTLELEPAHEKAGRYLRAVK